MVERSLSMREVPGSMPGASKILFLILSLNWITLLSKMILEINRIKGEVVQMVERSLSMREVPGLMPGASKYFLTIKKLISFPYMIRCIPITFIAALLPFHLKL